jgi:hypothetical protein
VATKTKISIAKMKACTNPTKISRNKNGRGMKKGARNPTITKSTSPAKIFPKRRKENEIILMNSEINSRRPTKEKMGLFKVKNFERCFLKPRAKIPRRFTLKTEITEIAIVKLRSLAGDRKKGTRCEFLRPTEPTPGKSPSQFEESIKIKTVAISGKYFSERYRDPKTESIRLNSFSTKNSKKF